MKTALVGYGKMGHELDRLAPAANVEIVERFDIDRPLRSSAATTDFDVAIEFSTPDTVVDNIKWLAEHRKQIVIGTTGWYSWLPEVRAMVEAAGIGLIYSSNFSIGMFLFNRLVADAARAFHQFPEYDVALHETHHRAKLDAPSGTAITLAKSILEEWPEKRNMVTTLQGGIPSDGLNVSSTRVGKVVGEHIVRIDSAADTITLQHSAHNRTGFASGALLAAKWIEGKHGVFGMEEMMDDLIG